MKRLTGRAPDGTAYLYNMGGTNAAIDCLAAYEDTGLEPWEIKKISEYMATPNTEIERYRTVYDAIYGGNSSDRESK